MVTELIRPVNYNPGRSQKLIKLEISSDRCSQLECNEESDETEGYSALYTPLLTLNGCTSRRKTNIYGTCGKIFTYAYYLKWHMAVNAGVKP